MLESQGSHRSQAIGTHANATAQASLCEVYYFHTDQVGLPEELSNAQGQIIWQRVLAGPPLLLRSTTKQAGETRCCEYPNH